MKKGLIWLIALIVVILGVGAFYYYNSSEEVSEALSFKVNTILLKSSINSGESVFNTIKITNLDKPQNFYLRFENLGGLAYINEPDFYLGAGDEKELKLTFMDSPQKNLGIYTGSFIIKTDLEEKVVPVILEIQSRKPVFATNLVVASKYKELKVGEDMFVEIRLFNLKDSEPHDVKVISLIKNFENEIVVSESDMRVVSDGPDSFSKTIALPKDISLGNYVFGVVTESEISVSTSSFLFSIVDDKSSFFKDADSFTVIFSAVVIVIILIIVVLVVYLIYERDKLFFELRKQHDSEMKILMEELGRRRYREENRIKEPKERKAVEKRYKIIKQRVVQKIKEKHEQQTKIFKELRKHKKISEAQRRLRQWKKQGFNVEELDIISRQVKKDLGNQINEWKKQGYKV